MNRFTKWWRRRQAKPYDWAEHCPELEPRGHGHVHRIAKSGPASVPATYYPETFGAPTRSGSGSPTSSPGSTTIPTSGAGPVRAGRWASSQNRWRTPSAQQLVTSTTDCGPPAQRVNPEL